MAFNSPIGYGPYPGGLPGGYGGLLGGGVSPNMGLLSDTLTGLGVGLLSQGPSNMPIPAFAGAGQGLQYANQLNQQRRSAMQQQFQNQQSLRAANLQQQQFGLQTQGFGLEQQKAQREAQQFKQQQDAIAQMTQGMDPATAAMVRAAPDAYIKNQLPAPTDVEKNYRMYVQQATAAGQQPMDLAGYQKYLAQAGANNTTVNMPPAEKAYNTALGQQEGGEIGSISSSATTARNTNDQLAVANALRTQLQQAGTDTSRLLPIVTQISSMGQALGVDTSKLGGQTPDATAAAQALDSVTKKLALGNIGSGKDSAIPANNFSEADRNFVVGIAPNIADTPEGFGAKALITQRVNQRSLDKETLWNSGKYNQLDEGDYRKFKSDWAQYVAGHPLFSTQEKQNFMKLVRTGNSAPNIATSPPTAAAPLISPQLPAGFQ